MANILVVGSINMDLVVRVERMPIPGETILGRDFQAIPGGKGANQAVAAARLGAIVTLVGRVGEDRFGKELLQNLQKENIDTQFVKEDQNIRSGVALITLDSTGQNWIVVAAGANLQLTPQEVRLAAQQMRSYDAVVAQLESPLDCVIEAAIQAKLRNVPFILNPAPAQRLPGELLNMVSVLVPNESEAAILAGKPIVSFEQAKQAAHVLLESGVGAVVLTLGSQGALIALPGESIHKIKPHEVEVIDTTAAGDAFVAALATGLSEGKSIRDAVVMGNAAGALAVTRFGAQTSMPNRNELSELLGLTK